MSRAEALAALIERVEAGTADHSDCAEVFPPENAYGRNAFHDAWDAQRGSLDAAASLEAPLRERGWTQNVAWFAADWHATWKHETRRACQVSHAATEARARLLAVLRALLHEAEEPAP